MKCFLKVLLIALIIISVFGTGFVLGFYKGETIYNYVFSYPFQNTDGVLDWSIIWTAIAGIGTLLLGIVSIWLNGKINTQNIRHKEEIEERNLKHTEELFKKQKDIEENKSKAEIEAWKLMARTELFHQNSVIKPIKEINDLSTNIDIAQIIYLNIDVFINDELYKNQLLARNVFNNVYPVFYSYCASLVSLQKEHQSMRDLNNKEEKSIYETEMLFTYVTLFKATIDFLYRNSCRLINYLDGHFEKNEN